MGDPLPSITVILCRPQEAGNIGSVCRAMKSMGMTRLRIVGPAPAEPPGRGGPELDGTPVPRPEEAPEARILAVHATDVLEEAERFEGLGEAVRGHALVAGVTRRAGRWRKQLRLSPEELADRVAAQAGSPVAVVFGNEESGLSDEELESCNLAVGIPSSPLCPSLNLSHAVQIVTYALFCRLRGTARTPLEPVSGERVDEVAEALMASLREAGFFRQGFEEEMRLLYRDILARASLSESEAHRVEKCFRIQRALVAHLRRRGGGGD